MLGLMLLGTLLYLRGEVTLAGVAATLGALIKPTALLALPVFWRPWNWRLPLLVASIALCLSALSVGVGWGVLGFLPGYLAEEGLSAGGGFTLLSAWCEHVTGPIPHGGTDLHRARRGTSWRSRACAPAFATTARAAASVRALGCCSSPCS